MNEIVEQIKALKVVPVLVIEHVKDAAPVADALCEGGLPIAEVTFRTEHAKEVIKKMKEARPELLVGAGTVLTCKQVDEAIEAGASFLVSPGLNEEVVKYARERGILMIPGCVTPTEIEKALTLGLKLLKFFPAEPSGGAPMLKALTAPYRDVEFMPTGGIQLNNIKEYLQLKQVIGCGGSWMVSADLLEEENYEEILRRIKEIKEHRSTWN